MRIAIEHTTRYRYATEASYSIQSLRLTPAAFEGQKVLDWQIACHPAGGLVPLRDGFGNVMHLMMVEELHSEIEISATGMVEVDDCHGIVRGLHEGVPTRMFLRRTDLTAPNAQIVELAGPGPVNETLPWLHDLMGRIRDRVDYVVGVTGAATTAAEAVMAGQGVCQDHAHIFIAAARVAGIPARYVTGYLLIDETSAEPAHHAWAEAWVGGLGWVGFDVANRICPTDRYVRMAAALDAHHAAPIRGSRRGGGAAMLEVHVLVQQQQNVQQ